MNPLIYGLIASIFTSIMVVGNVEKFSVRYPVEAKSLFKLKRHLDNVEYGQLKIGSFSFKNNTVDGFEVVLASMNGSELKPTDYSDGSGGIPYSVSLTPLTSVLDASVQQNLSPNLSIPGYPVQVIYLIDLPNQSSYGQYDIVVNIGDETQTTMDLAGNYEDTLELIYRDI
ncbi:MAG: hypothetical protein P8L47_02190 [Candidatus Marinamargulisbacteria bacterium]|jgi:hypothetical protein|nr:hypothetical protein [bacterium]MDG2264914.1 hypothetical protein [Candidatus Marinamargulisbacteria bacterium]|tara:strand:- start:4863 stop:5375 length:513 start_codon:yes stop_codon:yes gene_type:complete